MVERVIVAVDGGKAGDPALAGKAGCATVVAPSVGPEVLWIVPCPVALVPQESQAALNDSGTRDAVLL